MVLEKSLDHLLRGVFKGGNDLFIHCFMNSYCDFFFPFFFPPPSYLKGSSEDYESVESHVLNKGSGVDTEVTGKQSLAINTEQTTETTKQAELNC